MTFGSYHPAINLLFFTGVIACAAAFDHPIALGIGWVCAFGYSVLLNGKRALGFNGVVLLLVVLFALFFSSYAHFGMTVLGRNFIGNQYTLESLVVGIVLGMKVATIVVWLSCMHTVFTSDKVVYLFGCVSPRLSLMLSVLLRAVPRIKREWRQANLAQAGLGRATWQGHALRRLRNALRVASVVVTRFMDSSLVASESMRSRGVLLRGRSAFSLYRFDARDRAFVLVMFLCLILVCAGAALDQMSILYDPQIVMNRMTPLSALFFCAYAALCLLPMTAQVIATIRYASSNAETMRRDVG